MTKRAAHKLGFWKSGILLLGALAAIGGPLATGGVHATALQTARRAFEVVSVRPSNSGPETLDFAACQGGPMQLDPGRFATGQTTLYSLITLAYGIRYSCFIVNDKDLLSGGPSWVLSDRFDVQATIPAGTPTYTVQQLRDGAAPEIQEMLQTFLADRFKLVVHKSSKDTRVYVLTSASRELKLSPPDDTKPKRVGIGLVPDENKEILVQLVGNKASIEDLTHVIEPVTHTPVLDRTNIKGTFSFDVKFAVIEPFSGPLANLVVPQVPRSSTSCKSASDSNSSRREALSMLGSSTVRRNPLPIRF